MIHVHSRRRVMPSKDYERHHAASLKNPSRGPCQECGRLCNTDANGHFCSNMCTNTYAAKKARKACVDSAK